MHAQLQAPLRMGFSPRSVGRRITRAAVITFVL